MAISKEPSRVRLIVGVIHASDTVYNQAIENLKNIYGNILSSYGPEDFNHTVYYNKEMGEGLKRSILVFKNLVSRGSLSEIKLSTNKIESDFSNKVEAEGKMKRRINLDPGIMSLENFVLASCKGFSHRIYISNGVYGDLTLLYKDNSYGTLPWTYPDYACEKMIHFLNGERKKYKKEIDLQK